MSYQPLIQAAIDEMNLRGYSPRTIDSYSSNLNKFLHFIGKPAEDLTSDDVRAYLLNLKSQKLSTSYINGSYSVCQLFFKVVLKKPFSLTDVPRVKNTKKLPMVLSKSEVIAILDSVENMKHRAILMTAYSAGLRVSEVVRLKVTDIDSENMQIFVRSGKGDKDRYTILSMKTLLFLREYFKTYQPSDWLFYTAYDRSNHLSVRTVQHVFKAALMNTSIHKPATVHTLRHSFASHLLLAGVDLFTIKTLMGHKNIQTTMIYLHLTPCKVLSVMSPLDMEVPDDK